MSIAKLVTAPIEVTEHADAVLELAFLMSAADANLDETELAAFRELFAIVRGKAPSQEEIDALLGRFIVGLHGIGVQQRVREVSAVIPAALRETAFKVAVGLSLVDSEETEDEDDLVGILGASLGLAERTVALAREAREALES